MNCVEFRRILNERIRSGGPAEATSEADGFDGHRHGCAECNRRYLAAVALCADPGYRFAEQPQLVQQTMRRVLSPSHRAAPRRVMHRSGAMTVSGWVAAAAMAVLALWLALAPQTAAEDTVVVRFELVAPRARQVAVVGDWNDWNPEAHTMQRRNGVWELSVPLTRGGEYRYQFLIDNTQWIPDPEAPIQIEDGFGGINSLLDI